MEIGIAGTGSVLGKEILREILNKEFPDAEDMSLDEKILKKRDLTGLIICANIGMVNDFAIHFRDNLMCIIHTPMIEEIIPLNLGVVFTGEIPEAQGIIDRLRIDIDEILGLDNNIGIELLRPDDLKRKRIMICDDSRVLASELVHFIEARKVDTCDDFYIPRNQKSWKNNPNQSLRSQHKATNSRFDRVIKLNKKGYKKMP